MTDPFTMIPHFPTIKRINKLVTFDRSPIWLIIFLVIVTGVFVYHLLKLPMPLNAMGVKPFVDKISLTDEIIYGDVFSLGGGDWNSLFLTSKLKRDVRVAIIYPFMWVIINAKDGIYAMADSQTAPKRFIGDGEFDPCPSGKTFVQFNKPTSGLGETNMRYKCMPLSLSQLINNAEQAYALGSAERVHFKFETLLHENVHSITLTDCVNYLLANGLMTNVPRG